MSAINGFNVQTNGYSRRKDSGQTVQERLINPERVAEKVKQKAEKLIEEISLRYLENFPQQSERDARVLWQLAFAYEQKSE